MRGMLIARSTGDAIVASKSWLIVRAAKIGLDS